MTEASGVPDEQLHRPTAGQFDVWARIARLGVVLGLILGLVPPLAFGLTGPVAVAVLAVLILAPAVVAIALSVRSSRVARLEREAGYSTIYDFEGYELRDPRTLAVLRAADVRPTGTMRRSMFRAMLTVKPGTLLAKRLEEDEREER